MIIIDANDDTYNSIYGFRTDAMHGVTGNIN